MAHYAFLDENNVVVKVITGVDETVTQLDNGVEGMWSWNEEELEWVAV